MRQRKQQGQRNQQLSDEELQRTQVLNLQDFKETARIEKLSSKKPAIFVAMIGICMITIGMAFPAVQSMSARKEAEAKKQQIEQRKQEEEANRVEETEIVCHYQALNKADQTDENIDVTFKFEDKKLKSAKKEYRLTKSVGVTEEPAELSSYLSALQPFLMQINGYSVSVQTIQSGSITTTEVDYTQLDISKIPAAHQENYRFNVIHQLDETPEEAIAKMTPLGYGCK